MSILSRPSVVFAIVFACFAVLIPRIFLPLLRSKPSAPSNTYDDHFRRPSPPMPPNENSDTIQHIPGSPPHMRGAHPNMRMHHPGANDQKQPATDQGTSKSIVTLALPMYTVGIGIFFIYTCCKYWSRKNTDECKIKKKRGLNNDLLWDSDKRKLKCDILDKDSEEEENKEDFYAGLDPDYLEYLKSKKQKALDAERVMTDEQKQMHYALEEMKKSLSFISSKIVTKESRGNLDGSEIDQLQERLASTEAQMCKILTALDTASDKISESTKNAKTKKEQESIEKESLSSSSDEELVPNQIDDNEDEPLSSSNSSAEEEEENEDDQSPPMVE